MNESLYILITGYTSLFKRDLDDLNNQLKEDI